MAVNLSKGQTINLSKSNSQLSNLAIGLGWDINRHSRFNIRKAFDLDSAVFLVSANGKIREKADFVFFGNLKHPSGAVKHTGDNLTGAGSGDDEIIKINLKRVPEYVEKIIITVSIYEAEKRKQNFGQVENAYINLYDLDKDELLLQYSLSEEFGAETAVVFAEVEKINNEWKFNAVGNGVFGGLITLCKNYGVNVR